MTRIDNLHVKGFRGIVDSALPFECGSIILGGGNGTGKSGFVDALEFLYFGSLSTLEGSAGLSLRQHAPHIHAERGQTEVRARFDQPAQTAVRRLSAPSDVPVELQEHLVRGSSLSFILRRPQIQQFIHAKPAERYRSMADLIGIEELERTEMSLKRARDSLHDGVQSLTARRTAAVQRISTMQDENLEIEDLFAEANERLAHHGFPDHHLTCLDDVDGVRNRILQAVAATRPDPLTEARVRLGNELERSVGEDHLLAVLSTYLSLAPDRRSAGGRAQSVELLQVLRAGREYLRHTETHSCPLCQHTIVPNAVLSGLMKRLTDMEEVSIHQERVSRAVQALDVALQDVSSRLHTLERALREAGVQSAAAVALANAVTMLRETLRVQAVAETLEMAGRVDDAIESWKTWKRDMQASLVSGPQSPDEPDERQLAAGEALAVLEQVRVVWARQTAARADRARLHDEIMTLDAALEDKGQALSLAEQAYATFIRVKNREVQLIFDGLREDLVRFFDQLHPGEGHAALSIAMDPRKRGSSELRMDYFDARNEDPRAYFSEAHLDSLGLCIFLAFVKRFNGDWPLLALDDVVTSVDAAHKQRIADLLFQEFGETQLLLTTQDARWFNELRRAAEDAGRGTTTKAMVIESWSLETGPSLRVKA